MNNLEIKVQGLEDRISNLEEMLNEVMEQLDKPKRDQSFGDDKPSRDKRETKSDGLRRKYDHNKHHKEMALKSSESNSKKICMYLSDGEHRTLDEIREALGLGKKTVLKALAVSRWIEGDGHSDSRQRRYHLTKGVTL